MTCNFTCPVLRALPFVFVLAMPIAAQDLGRPTARWNHDFSRIAGAAELADGRVVVVDASDELVFVAGATGGEVTQLGRTGDGPNEYRRPFSLFHGSGDTVLVYARNRLLRITPDGRLSGSVRFTPAGLGSLAPPRGVDRLGRIYWDRPVIIDPVTKELKRQQLYEIVRWKPGAGEVELAARASDHAPELDANKFHPFAQRDAWVVDPDGSLRIVRARDYSVDLVRDGKIVRSSTPIPYQATRVTAEDREAYRLSRAANAPTMTFKGRSAGGGGGATPERLALARKVYPDDMFPRTLPPFEENGVLRSPAGELWVIRSHSAGDQGGGQVDVLDMAGRLMRSVTLPAGRRLLALEHRGIYLVREDDDGLQYLERYAWPAGLD